ncbi:MAG TPA: AarF/UbiB family protein, partial [Bacillota bacterium]|nr:AarF/UbiB family protein [Bacillota bacterium]
FAFAKRYPRISNSMDLDKVYAEFREVLSDELDYVKEAENAEWARECFLLDETVYVPKVYPHYSTSRVLTLEYVEGFKINDFQALDQAGINRAELAKHLVDCFLRQVLVEGFYHADPHPGNLLVSSEGVLILLDFGMVGRVDRQMKASMVDLAVALFKKDAGGVVEAFDALGFLRPHADRSTLHKSVHLMLASLFGETPDLGRLDFTELYLELRELVYSQPFQIPAETTFLGKALITIFGLCNGLDPRFDLMEAVSPFIKDMFVSEDTGGVAGQIFEQIKTTALELVAFPEKVNRFIEGVETGEVRFQPSRSFEQRMLEQQARQTNRIVRAVLASGLIISGAQLMEQYYLPGVALLVAGGAAALLLLAGSTGAPAVARQTGMSGGRARRPMGKMGSGFKKPRLHP